MAGGPQRGRPVTCSGLFVLPRGRVGTPQVDFTLSEMRSVCDRLVIVVSHADVADLLGRFHPDEVLVEPLVEASYLAGVRAGLLSMTEMTGGARPSSPIIVSGSHVLAPIGPVAPLFDHLADSGGGLFAPSWPNI